MNKQDLFNITLLILTSLTWAGSFLIVEATYKQISPLYLGFLRFVVATPIMFLIVILQKKSLHIPKKEIPYLIILGLTGVTFLYIFQFFGIAFTTASTASVLINTNVLFIAIFSAIFLHEKFTWNKTIGVLISFVGAVLVITGQMTNKAINVNEIFLIGSALVILSALCWATYSIVGKKILSKYDPFTLTAIVFLYGVILYLPFVLPGVFEIIPKITLPGLLAILYLGILCSVFGYTAWYYVLANRKETSKTAVFLTMIPMFTIILSYIFKEEIPTTLFFIGAIFIMIGVYLTQQKIKIK